jgi:ABC-type lipoprotein release transport system permease subunit
MRLIAIGVIAGLALALAGGRVLASLLLDVSTVDPVTYVGVCVFFAFVSAAACYVPARRAMRVEPVAALRVD